MKVNQKKKKKLRDPKFEIKNSKTSYRKHDFYISILINAKHDEGRM